MTDIQPDPNRRNRRDVSRRPVNTAIQQQKSFTAKRHFPPTKLVSDDQLEAIHHASLKVLAEIGMDFMLPEARDILKKAGARIDGERVRFDPAMITEAMAHAPETFTVHSRNPERKLQIGGDNIVFGTVGSPPNCHDIEGGRRTGNREDFRKFIKLGQHFNAIDFMSGYPVEPIDVHAGVRHLEVLRDVCFLADKPFVIYCLGEQRVQDGMEIARLARGISHEQFDREASVMTIINTNSPLKLDNNMLDGMIQLSRRNQMICVTPFTLAGAMAPVTVAGALVEQNAEALAGMAFCQLVNPGAPVVYGGFTSNVDMKSGAPAFGTPEYMKSTIIGGQLARRYKVPFRTSNTNAANMMDAQAAYESVFSLWGLTMGGGNFIMHGAGWLEGGLVASFEKFVMDCDLIQMVKSFLQPIEINDDALGVEAIREVGPGGHFFGAQHTLARYSDAFYAPMVSNWSNNQQWDAAGRPDALQRSNALYKQALNEYTPPPMDEGVKDALDDFVNRRLREGGVATDF
jgi:trimethylamine---corrinoid protein Co-methyltransferase